MKPKPIVTVLFLVLVATLTSVQFALAQDSAPSTATDASADISADDVNSVAKELWCPLCSGVRLDACELRACDQMKDVIADKLTAGETTQNIKNYFVQQYGPQVLGEPPLEGFNWLAWLLPVLVVAGGGVFLWSRTRSMMRKPTATAASVVTEEPGDHYSAELEKELKEYD